ncbi:glycosyltransferase [Burkholderiaceae bacterium DAT-1]|nr:glycosyltransferase [Burkholderiaceae bacterium DAT-1]
MKITFIIPIRIDSKDRLINLSTVIRQLSQEFTESEIIVIEQSDEQKAKDLALKGNCRYVWQQSDTSFCKSLAINHGLKIRQHKICCVYDADVLISSKAISLGVNIIENSTFQVVLPYNQICTNITGKTKEFIIETLDFSNFSNFTNIRDAKSYKDATPHILNGGVILFNAEIAISCGGFNKKMISYGWEDTEFHVRLRKLGYPMYMLHSFSIVHLDHQRGADSKPNENYFKNETEFFHIKNLNKKQLAAYVENELYELTPNETITQLIKQQSIIKLAIRKIIATTNWIYINIRIRDKKTIINRALKSITST